MGPDQQRLRIGIGNGAQTYGAVELGQIAFKFGTERGAFDVVDLALETLLGIIKCQAATLGTQVRMVVSAKEYIILQFLRETAPKKPPIVEILLKE